MKRTPDAALSGDPSGVASRRPGFSMVEVVLAFAVLASAGVLVAHVGTWALTERAAADARLEAVEAVANQLEGARARPWAELTAEWAAGRKLPDYLAARWPDAKLAVRVEPEADRPRVKRVTAELTWADAARKTWTPVSLTALFADRTPGGGK
jgi:hypothetical protein